jgi:hypothetical protein
LPKFIIGRQAIAAESELKLMKDFIKLLMFVIVVKLLLLLLAFGPQFLALLLA